MCFLRKGPFLGKELEQAKFFCTSSYFFHLSFLKKQKAWLRHHWLQNCTYFEKLHIFFKFELMKTPTMSPAQSNEQYLIRLKISLLHNTPLWGVCKTYIMRSILLIKVFSFVVLGMEPKSSVGTWMCVTIAIQVFKIASLKLARMVLYHWITCPTTNSNYWYFNSIVLFSRSLKYIHLP